MNKRARSLRQCIWVIVVGTSILLVGGIPAQSEPYIAMYKGGRSAAISFTFDDGFRSQVENAREIIEPLGIRGTLFLIPHFMDGETKRESTITFEEAEELLLYGHEVGTHGSIGAKLQDASKEEVRSNVNRGWGLLRDNLGVKPISYAAPGGSKVVKRFPDVVEEKHYFIRSEKYLPQSDWIAYGNTRSREWSDEKTRIKIEGLRENGGWGLGVIHAIVEGWAPFKSKDEFRTHCEWVKAQEDWLWIAPLSEVGRYAFEREAAKLEIISIEEGKLVFRVTHNLEPREIFNMPLTVVIPEVKAERVRALGRTHGESLPSKSQEGRLLVEAPVDGREVIVLWE